MPEIFDLLTEGCGWTAAEYENWPARTLVGALLEPETGTDDPHTDDR